MALTGEKRLFAKAVLAEESNKDAAMAAGCSAATTSQAGSRLVDDKEVVAYMARQKIAVAPKAKPKKSDVDLALSKAASAVPVDVTVPFTTTGLRRALSYAG
jgi:phage terminase small subunit